MWDMGVLMDITGVLSGLEPEYEGVLRDITGVIIVLLFEPWTSLDLAF